MNDRIYLSPPYMCGNEMKYVQEAFDKNWIAPLGPNVTAFEKAIASYAGVNHAVATSSGTAAIHLALRYFGVGPGDIVFCSDLTFAASCNPIVYLGATPVFIDSKPDGMNVSPVALSRAFAWAEKKGKLPKAVVSVDLYGQSADYDELLPICRRYGVPVVEDAAEALGASYGGKKCGSFGDIGIFSFNGNKILTTSGGGMAVTNDANAAEKMLFWATQAREKEIHYEHKDYGYNYRLSNICAGIGRGQLEGLPFKLCRRKEVHDTYKELLEGSSLELLPLFEKVEPNYWLSVAAIKREGIAPAMLCAALEAENVEARPAWKPMHMQPIFKGCEYFSHEGMDVGENLFGKGICLPSGEALRKEDQERITGILRRYLDE